MKIEIRDEGTIIMFTPLDDEGTAWLEENVQSEPWQWWGRSLAVDRRYAEPIATAIMEFGPD